MSFQACPICQGTGFALSIAVTMQPCTVCQGAKIISSSTGQPPAPPSDVAQAGGSVPGLSDDEILRPPSPLDEYTDEEIAFYATPYFDELRAKRERQSKKREEET